ncbi:MAG: YcxB family protein [Solobacterium sp.]|nr:YcxB family protein [Solobacterium sp.]
MKADFVNTYDYTEVVSREAQTAFIFHETFPLTARIGTIVLFAGGMIAAWYTHNPAFLFFSAAAFLMAGVKIYGVWHAVKEEMKRIKTKYGTDHFHPVYSFGEQIYFKAEQKAGTVTVPLKAIESFTETKNLFVVFLRGKQFIPVKKDSFTKGTEAEFRQYLKEGKYKNVS